MFFWLFYAIWMLETYFIYLCIEMMLTFRFGKNKWIQTAAVTLAYSVILYYKLKSTDADSYNSVVQNTSTLLGDVFICVYIICLHKEKIVRKVITFVVTVSACLITSILFEHILSLNNGSFGFDFNSIRGLKRFMASNGFTMSFITFMTIAYRSFVNKNRIKNGVAMTMFAANQIIIIRYFFSLDSLDEYSYENLLSTAGIACGYLADILLFLIVDRQTAQESVYRNIKKIKEARELETVKYQALQKRHDDFAKLRHDYNNQLTTVQLLLESGNEDEAFRLARELLIRLNA